MLSHLPLKQPCCYLPFYKWGNQQNDHRTSQSSMGTIHYQVLVFNNPLIVRKNLFSKKYKLPTCHLIQHPIQASSMGTMISVPTELDHLPQRPCLSLHILCAGMVATQFRTFLISFRLILILHYSLLTATLSLITVFRIYDQNDKCFHTQRVLITITSQKSSQLWLKETEVTRPVQLTEAVPKAERDPWTA